LGCRKWLGRCSVWRRETKNRYWLKIKNKKLDWKERKRRTTKMQLGLD
jgi:hypothetical protein